MVPLNLVFDKKNAVFRVFKKYGISYASFYGMYIFTKIKYSSHQLGLIL